MNTNDTINAIEILKTAEDLLQDGQCWIVGTDARVADTQIPVRATDTEANRFCLMGAIIRAEAIVMGDTSHPNYVDDPIDAEPSEALRLAIESMVVKPKLDDFLGTCMDVMDANDLGEFESVKDMLDRGIERLNGPPLCDKCGERHYGRSHPFRTLKHKS